MEEMRKMREKTLCLLLADQGVGVSLSHDALQNAILNHYDLGGCIMIYKPDKVSKMKGADIIAEYMMKEKIPYMIGYAGHGASSSSTSRTTSKLYGPGLRPPVALWPTPISG